MKTKRIPKETKRTPVAWEKPLCVPQEDFWNRTLAEDEVRLLVEYGTLFVRDPEEWENEGEELLEEEQEQNDDDNNS